MSGGYTLEQSAQILARNHRLIASFSRALTEGLTAEQTDDEFNEKLKANIDEVYQASLT